MAYINGNEILFSASVTGGGSGGGVQTYEENGKYFRGELVAYNGLLYSPIVDETSTVPTNTAEWADLTAGRFSNSADPNTAPIRDEHGIFAVGSRENYAYRKTDCVNAEFVLWHINNRARGITSRIDHLEGMLIKYVEDDEDFYEKPVPENSAHKAILAAVGGTSAVVERKEEIINKDYASQARFSLGVFTKGDYEVTITQVSSWGISSSFDVYVSHSLYAENVAVGEPFSLSIDNEESVEIDFKFGDDVSGVIYNAKVTQNGMNTSAPSAPVTAIESVAADGSIIATYEIPPEIQALDGYGKGIDSPRYNFIDFLYYEFVKVCGEKTITADEVELAREYSNVVYYRIPKPTDDRNNGQNLAYGFRLDGYNNAWLGTPFNDTKHIGYCLGNASKDVYWVGFPVGTSLEEAQAALNGKTLMYMYPDSKKVKTDISQYLTGLVSDYDGLVYLDVEAGGKIRFVNENKIDVPSIVYFVLT